jgi:hypothetical protein
MIGGAPPSVDEIGTSVDAPTLFTGEEIMRMFYYVVV